MTIYFNNHQTIDVDNDNDNEMIFMKAMIATKTIYMLTGDKSNSGNKYDYDSLKKIMITEMM